jgi:hypothetical protein
MNLLNHVVYAYQTDYLNRVPFELVSKKIKIFEKKKIAVNILANIHLSVTH